MKNSLAFLFILISKIGFCQSLSGKLVDLADNKPLVYVSIGIIGTSIGTISNENGEFNLDVSDLQSNSRIRFSLIGYLSRELTLDELNQKTNIIKLECSPIILNDVIVKPLIQIGEVGTKKSTSRQVCGWSGTSFGKGCEIGIKVNFGSSIVKVKDLNIKLYKQTFDSSLLRLHIRRIENGEPTDELINKEVFVSITNKSGWIKVDLNKYDFYLSGEALVSLEWIKVDKSSKERVVKVNNKASSSNLLFSIYNLEGITYTRKGCEAKWNNYGNQSPTFYLSILK